MPYWFRFALLPALLFTILAPNVAAPHSGGLDAYGCHHDRQHGNYHCHRGQFTGQSFASQAEMQTARQENYTAFPPILPASQFSGKVVSVLDGDTIDVLHNKRAKRIRLNGIDCPEKGQAYGNRAKQAASALVFGRDVILQTHGQDKYGRTLANVLLLDGTNMNQELVKQGWCWWYWKYAPEDTVLEGLEKDAREAKKGLWADPAPIPPWVYRKAKRGQALDLSDTVLLGSNNERTGSTPRRDNAEAYAFLAFLQNIAAQKTARLCERGVPGYRQRFDGLYARWFEKHRDMIATGERVFRDSIRNKDRPDTDYSKLEQIEKAMAGLAQSPRATNPITLDERMRAVCEENLVELETSLN